MFAKRSLNLLPSLTALSALLSACSVSTPFRWPGYDSKNGLSAAPKQETVLIAITHQVVDRKNRGAFDQYTQKLLRSMHNQPGLIGYSARKQLFGDQAWTVSLWLDEAALESFVRSPEHREAMRAGRSALVNVRFRRATVKVSELPIGWTEVLAILEDGQTPPAVQYGATQDR